MGRLVVAVLALGLALAGWRNLPPMENAQSSAAGLALAGTVVLAFVLGRRSTRAEAIAMAMATARAESTARAHAGAQSLAQVVVVTGDGQGAREAAERAYGRPAWVGARHVDVEQLHGSDAYESIAEELADYDEQR